MMVNVKIQNEGGQTSAYINGVLFLKGEDASTVIQAAIDEMDRRKSLASDTERSKEQRIVKE